MKDVPTGRASRAPSRSIIVISAVFVAAMMLALPMAASFDSEAEFTEADAGYTVDISDKASDSELSAVYKSKFTIVRGAIPDLFSDASWFWSAGGTATIESFHYLSGTGDKVEKHSTTLIQVQDVELNGFHLVLTSTKSASMLDFSSTDKEQAIADALAEHFGTDTISAGDKMEFSGNYREKTILKVEAGVVSVDDTHSVVDSMKMVAGSDVSYEITVKYTPNGSTESKSAVFSYDVKGSARANGTVAFETDVKDVKDGDATTVRTTADTTMERNKASAKIAGVTYDMSPEDASGHQDQEEPSTADIITDSEEKPSTYVPSYGSSENVKVDKTYSAVESAYKDLEGDFTDNKGHTAFYIGLAVGIVAIIGVVAFVLLRKRA